MSSGSKEGEQNHRLQNWQRGKSLWYLRDIWEGKSSHIKEVKNEKKNTRDLPWLRRRYFTVCKSHMGFPICNQFHHFIKKKSGIAFLLFGIQVKVTVEGESGNVQQLFQYHKQKCSWLSRANAQMPEPGAHLLHHLAAALALPYEWASFPQRLSDYESHHPQTHMKLSLLPSEFGFCILWQQALQMETSVLS